MYKPAQIVAISFALCSVSNAAHANRLKLTDYGFEDGVGKIELLAKEPIGEPWLRLDRGGVRIWFPDMEDISRFDHNDDTHAIQTVRLRYGSDNTALLKLDFSDHRSLRKDDIEIVRNGERAVIKVYTAHRPAPQPQGLAALAAPASSAQASPMPVLTAGQAPAQPVAPSYRRPFAPKNPLPLPIGPAPSQKPQPQPALHFSTPPRGLASSAGALLLASLGLGAIYGFIHFGNRRQLLQRQGLQIDVVSSKRIGHRQQLLVVRALGQDHLLSLNGGRIERLGSAPSPNADAVAEDERAARMRLGLFTPFFPRKKRDTADFASDPDATLPGRSDDSAPFGEELMSFVRNQGRRSSPGKTPIPPGLSHASSSDAVAGIARLRGRALS